MSRLLRLVHKMPLCDTRLAWERALLDRIYGDDIASARKAKDNEKVESLIAEHRFELDLHQDEEDAYFTKRLLREARRLWIPAPPIYNEDGSPSDHWYQHDQTGRWHLTRHKGMTSLRESIRNEGTAQHEARSRWIDGSVILHSGPGDGR